jgi:hypothetical protein
MIQIDISPHCREGLQVQIDGPGADGAASRQRDLGPAASGQKGAQEEDGCPHGFDQIVRGLISAQIICGYLEGAALFPESRTQVCHDLLDGPNVSESGDPFQAMPAAGQETGSHHRKGRIFGPADADSAFQGIAPLNNDLVHGMGF